MADIATGIEDVRDKISDALRGAEADSGASPVLVAVVREFAKKAEKAIREAGPEAVIELEQAGDSAKAAAEADAAAGSATRKLVLDAHLAICMLKASVVTGST